MPGTQENRPTLRDVATAAGVGTTTVSRVINGGQYVAPELLARIQRVIAELGYKPNQFAQSLKSKRSKTIGLIIPFINNPFFAEFASVVETVARQAEYAVLLASSQDKLRFEVEDLLIFERHRVDGILLVPPRSDSRAFLQSLRAMSVPVVAFDRPLPARNYSSVRSNNCTASQTAVQHLIGHGRRRILCLGGDPSLYTIRERTRGYQDAMAGAGLETLIEHGVTKPELMKAVLERYLTGKNKVDAIFCLYNQVTQIAYQVLRDLSVRIPEDVGLIGFDQFSAATMLEPPITVVEQPIAELGRTAAQLLFDLVLGVTRSPQQIEVDSQLVVRRSCGCNPRGNESTRQL